MSLCAASQPAKPSLWQRAVPLHVVRQPDHPQPPRPDLRDLAPLSAHLLRDIGLRRD